METTVDRQVTPLIKTASSLARNAITPAISSGVAALPIGRRHEKLQSWLGFSQGRRGFGRGETRCHGVDPHAARAYSSAKARVKFVMAPFAAL